MVEVNSRELRQSGGRSVLLLQSVLLFLRRYVWVLLLEFVCTIIISPATCHPGKDYNREKLRQYELSRLKFYYAVVTCDSPETANEIYEKCDGIEYECSANKLDLRSAA